MRLVLDTNVAISALLWRGAPWRILKAGADGRHRYFTSRAIVAELEDVLSRPKLVKQIRLSGLTSAELTRTYLDVAAILEPIAVDGIAPDPDDDAVIGTAIAANADLLVTGDKGLLSVGSYKGCRIVSVQAAMDELMAY